MFLPLETQALGHVTLLGDLQTLKHFTLFHLKSMLQVEMTQAPTWQFQEGPFPLHWSHTMSLGQSYDSQDYLCQHENTPGYICFQHGKLPGNSTA